MSGDHNTGWRKRQIALDIKAEDARELGLGYEPDKTLLEMAREAGLFTHKEVQPELRAFAELVRADERGRMCEQLKECSNEKSTSNEANRSAVLGESGQAN